MLQGKSKYRNFLLLHLIVFIWGFSGILGKLITLQAPILVWYRCLIAFTVLFFYLKIKKVPLTVTGKQLLQFTGVGAVVAIHWLCFYQAIKVSNVSVTLACFSCGALFTAFIEPVFFKRRIDWREIVFGAVVIGAIGMIFTVETKYAWGIVLSVLAALTSALFSVFNGLLVSKTHSVVISFYELLAGFVIISIFFLVVRPYEMGQFNLFMPAAIPAFGSCSNLVYILLHGLVCTAFTFVIGIEVMKEINPYTVNLTVNLETIYSIILAYFIFGKDEYMSTGFYVATGLILVTVFGNALLKRNDS